MVLRLAAVLIILVLAVAAYHQIPRSLEEGVPAFVSNLAIALVMFSLLGHFAITGHVFPGHKVTVDPVFGKLQRGPMDPWQGEYFFQPAEQTVSISIGDGRSEPSDDQRAAMKELTARFDDLQKLIWERCFTSWSNEVKARTDEDLPDSLLKIASAVELSKVSNLTAINIKSASEVWLCYLVSADGKEPELEMYLELKDYVPTNCLFTSAA